MSRPADLYEVTEHGMLEVYWCFAGHNRPRGHWYAKVSVYARAAVGAKFATREEAEAWARAHWALATGPAAQRWADYVLADTRAFFSLTLREQMNPRAALAPELPVGVES